MKPTILAYLRAEYPAARQAGEIQFDLGHMARANGKPTPTEAAIVAGLEQLAAEKWAKKTARGWVYVPEVPAVKETQAELFR